MSYFTDLVDIVLPGTEGIVAAINAFFDESYNDEIFCVAGYIFKKSKLKRFDASWRAMLRAYALPFFRMSDCAHGNPPFDKLTKAQRVKVETNAIDLIIGHAARGIAITIERKDFKVPQSDIVQSPYELCAWTCLVAVSKWLSEERVNGQVAYFFEAGDAAQGHANELMYKIFEAPNLRERCHYSSHTFIEKGECSAVQAADLLAWQFFTDCKRKLADNQERRKDYNRLVKLRHDIVFHYDAAMLARGYMRPEFIAS